MLLADVIVDIPVKNLDTPFTYIVPDNGEGWVRFSKYHENPIEDILPIDIGCAVEVPFGRSKRREIAFVLRIYEGTPPKGARKISKVISKPFFSNRQVECAMYMAHEYVAPLSICLRLFVPPGAVPKVVRNKQGRPRYEKATVGPYYSTWIKLINPAFKPKTSAKIQQIILCNLLDAKNNELPIESLRKISKSAISSIDTLAKIGVVEKKRRRFYRFNGYMQSLNAVEKVLSAEDRFVLTPGQTRALKCIVQSHNSPSQVILLEGVTGSGKTEVYLRAIKSVLDKGEDAIVLVPEIALTPQTESRFRRRFGDLVAVIHSRMSPGERFDTWDYINSGMARVVVGARSALFAPLKNVGIIIIDEEHEYTYKQESTPRYNAKDVAIWLGRRFGCTVVLGSATPCLESLYQAKTNKNWHYIRMEQRTNGRSLPQINVIDMSLEFRNGEKSIISQPLKQALLEEIDKKNKVMMLLNQRGFANFLHCKKCGFVPSCIHCSTTLTMHEHSQMLECHYCGYEVVIPGECPICGSVYMYRCGAGTERVEAELRSLINVPIVRMDADTTSTKGAHSKLLDEFSSVEGAAVLIGTQMIAKGLDFDDVTLVGVINADTQLNLPDFRAYERTFALLNQVAGRAGRSKKAGRVFVQTYSPDSDVIKFASSYNRKAFITQQLEIRRMLNYPPYSRLANVLISGRDWRAVDDVANEAYRLLESLKREVFDKNCDFSNGGRQICDELMIYPICKCAIYKKSDNFRKHILIKSNLRFDLPTLLCNFKRQLRMFAGISVSIDIDPLSLM